MAIGAQLAICAAFWATVAFGQPTAFPTTENDGACAGEISTLRNIVALTDAEAAVAAAGSLSCLEVCPSYPEENRSLAPVDAAEEGLVDGNGEDATIWKTRAVLETTAEVLNVVPPRVTGAANPLKVDGDCPIDFPNDEATQLLFGTLVDECVNDADGAVWAFQTEVTCAATLEDPARVISVFDKFFCVPMLAGCLDNFEFEVEEIDCGAGGIAETLCGDSASITGCEVSEKLPLLPVEPINPDIGDVTTDSTTVCQELLDNIEANLPLQEARIELDLSSVQGCLSRDGNQNLMVSDPSGTCPYLYEDLTAVANYELACAAAGGQLWETSIEFSCGSVEVTLGPKMTCVPAAPGCLDLVVESERAEVCDSDPNELSLAYCDSAGFAPADPRFDSCGVTSLAVTFSPTASPSATDMPTVFDEGTGRSTDGGSSSAAVGAPGIIGIVLGAVILCCAAGFFFFYKNRDEDDDESIDSSVGSGKRRKNVRDPSIILRDPHFIVPPSSRSPRKRSSAASSRRSSRDSSRSGSVRYDMQPEGPPGAVLQHRASLQSIQSSRSSYRDDEHVDFMRIASGQLGGIEQSHDDAVDL